MIGLKRPAGPASVPEEYWIYDQLFKEKKEVGLPKHSQWDHEIILQPGKTHGFSKIYNMNEVQLKELHEYLDKHLEIGFI